jgi:hypothetical protein
VESAARIHDNVRTYGIHMALDSCPVLSGLRPVGYNKTFLHTIPILSVNDHVFLPVLGVCVVL